MKAQTSYWEQAMMDLKDRLREPYSWFPFPAFISFVLVTLLSGHLLPGLNPRLGSRARVPQFEASRQKEGGIWFGVYPKDDRIHVTTADRRLFQWSKVATSEELVAITKYLRQRLEKEARISGISMETSMTKTSVVLAVDERLKYGHILPMIYVLAKVGISKYGFETVILAD